MARDTNCQVYNKDADNGCYVCQIGFAVPTDGSGILCTEIQCHDEHCAVCTDTGEFDCLVCKANYIRDYINGKCRETTENDSHGIANCELRYSSDEYSLNDDKLCYQCFTNYILDDAERTCYRYTDNCIIADHINKICKSCKADYILLTNLRNESYCEVVTAENNCNKFSNCSSCSKTECHTCQENFVKTSIPGANVCSHY